MPDVNKDQNCPFCNGEVIEAENYRGGGTPNISMMLETLSGKKHEKNGYCSNGIQLENGNQLCFDNSAREYTLLSVEIKYCPFCGKELTADA